MGISAGFDGGGEETWIGVGGVRARCSGWGGWGGFWGGGRGGNGGNGGNEWAKGEGERVELRM